MENDQENRPPIPDELNPEGLFKIATAAINERYRPGTLEYIEAHRPELAGRIARAFDRVNDQWAAGPAAGPGFKRALRTWYDLNLEAINIFKGRNDE